MFKKWLVYTLKDAKKPNRNRAKSLYDLKLTIFQLEGVKLPLLEENCARNRQNVQKTEKNWLVFILKDATKAQP